MVKFAQNLANDTKDWNQNLNCEDAKDSSSMPITTLYKLSQCTTTTNGQNFIYSHGDSNNDESS